MITALARQIEARMKAKNISVLTLERETGLKGQGVRNIVRGKSKKPSAESLHAISEILDCTVKDLLGFKELFDDTNLPSRESILSLPYQQTPLLSEVITFVTNNWNKGGENEDTPPSQTINCSPALTDLHPLPPTLNGPYGSKLCPVVFGHIGDVKRDD